MQVLGRRSPLFYRVGQGCQTYINLSLALRAHSQDQLLRVTQIRAQS
jgi:hypothetical protein